MRVASFTTDAELITKLSERFQYDFFPEYESKDIKLFLSDSGQSLVMVESSWSLLMVHAKTIHIYTEPNEVEEVFGFYDRLLEKKKKWVHVVVMTNPENCTLFRERKYRPMVEWCRQHRFQYVLNKERFKELKKTVIPLNTIVD